MALAGKVRMKLGVVLGSADCLWADTTALAGVAPFVPWGPEHWPDVEVAILAVNAAMVEFRAVVHHAVTLHPVRMPQWLKERAVARWGDGPAPETWCHADGDPKLDHALPIRYNASGSSGLFAVQVAQHLGCDRIVLCGVPMDGRPHIDGADDWAWQRDFEGYRKAWAMWKAAGELANVRSMSGFTRELCGAPDAAWLR